MSRLGPCGFCGESGDVELFEHLRTSEIKVLCYKCADIVDRYCNKVANFAEGVAKKSTRELLRRLDDLKKEKVRRDSKWFFINIRAFLQRKVTTFPIGTKQEPQ